MITPAQTSTLATTTPRFFTALPQATKQAAATPSAESASSVTISEQGLRLAADAASGSDGTREQFRITGPLNQRPLVPLYKMPDALVKEMAMREQEEKLREDINFRYAYEHQYQPVGQVLVNGKLFAEVNEGGGYGLAHSLQGLNQNDMNPKARVEEIARALKGKGQVEIRYSNLVPGFGGWSGPSAPESALPAFTARSRQDIMQEAMDTMARLKSASAAPTPPIA